MFGSIAVILFTMIGGYRGDVITDFIMGIFIIIGLAVTAVFVTASVGGLDSVLAQFTPERLSVVSTDVSLFSQMDEWTIAIVGSLVSQEAISRFLGARSPTVARTACLLAAGMYLFIGLIPVYIGLAGADLIPLGEDTDAFLPDLVKAVLPQFAYLVFLAALVSAILSTINSTLLSVGALAGHNIMVPLIAGVYGTDADKLRIEKIMVAMAGLVTYAVASSGQSIYDLVETSSSFGSAGLLVCLMFGLWTKTGGQFAAVSTMVAGVISSFMFQYSLQLESGFMVSLATCVAVYLIVSWIDNHTTVAGGVDA
jgi:Na+/proline symporter